MFPIFIMEIADDEDRAYAQYLFEKYHVMMLRIARSLVYDSVEVEDIVSDTFIMLIRHLQRVREMDDDYRAAYITMAVKRTGLMLLRRRRSSPVVLFDDGRTERVADSAMLPDDQLIFQFDMKVVKRAISMLPENDRLMLYLKVVEHKTDAEVGREMGHKPQAVRQRFVRMRRKLRMYCRQMQNKRIE